MKRVYLVLLFFVSSYAISQSIQLRFGGALLDCSGKIFISGSNEYGSGAWGTFGNQVDTFTRIGYMSNIDAIAAGAGHVLAYNYPYLLGWGRNDNGQIDTSGDFRILSVRVIDSSLAVHSISAGFYHSLILDSLGKVWGLGPNNAGQLGSNTPPFSFYKPKMIDSLRGVSNIESGYDYSMVIDSNQFVWAFGQNSWGQCGIEDSVQNVYTPRRIYQLNQVLDIAAGFGSSYAVKTDGSLWAWGRNMRGELGTSVPISNNPNSTPTQVTGISQAVQVECGYQFAVGLLSNGKVMAWGRNDYYQLGDGTTQSRATPDYVVGLSGIQSIAIGGGVGLALDSSGQLFSWGTSIQGILASGSDTVKPIPTPVSYMPCNPLVGLPEQELKPAPQVEVFPNPSEGFIQLHYPPGQVAPLSMEVHSLNGERLLQQTAPAQSIDLSALAPGTYLLWLHWPQYRQAYKVLLRP